MARFIKHTWNVNVLLDCGCRAVVPGTVPFEVTELDCPWPERDHGRRGWVTFTPSDKGYWWQCAERGCDWVKGKKYEERFLACIMGAQSHARLHAHPVKVYADGFRGWVHVPLFLSDEIPY